MLPPFKIALVWVNYPNAISCFITYRILQPIQIILCGLQCGSFAPAQKFEDHLIRKLKKNGSSSISGILKEPPDTPSPRERVNKVCMHRGFEAQILSPNKATPSMEVAHCVLYGHLRPSSLTSNTAGLEALLNGQRNIKTGWIS